MGQGRPRLFGPDLYPQAQRPQALRGMAKGCRSIATGHEKLALGFAVMVKLAILRQYLRTLRLSDRT